MLINRWAVPMRRSMVLWLLASLASACSSTSDPSKSPAGITKVISYPDTVVLLVGDVPRQLSAFTTDSSSMSHAGQSWYNVFWKPITASFSTSDARVVSVDASGLVSGLAPGEATITAKADRATGTTKVYVRRYQPALQFVDLAAGFLATCGRTSDDRVYCATQAADYMYYSGPGAFGTTAPSDRCRTQSAEMYTYVTYYDRCSHIPLEVDGAHQFTTVALGSAYVARPVACALDSAGAVWCWGQQPVQELQLPRLKTISANSQSGDDGSWCGLTLAGAALCWTLGKTPTVVDSTHQFTSLSTYMGSACALDAAGAAWCWGLNRGGVLGDSTTVDHASPAPVNTQLRFTSLVAGGDAFNVRYACALDAAGQAYCWGGGQTTPAAAPTTEHFVSIAIASNRACGVTQAGTITCWTPGATGTIAGPTGTDWQRVFGGPYEMCGIAASGRAACWALNTSTNTWRVEDIPRGG